MKTQHLSPIEEELLCLWIIISWPVCLYLQSHSSQSSDRQSLACLQSDSSNSSTQVTNADCTHTLLDWTTAVSHFLTF